MLYHALAVVEIAFDSDIEHVSGLDRRHLQALHRRHPAQRVEDDQAHALGAGKGAHRRRPGIARSRGDQGQGLVALAQRAAGQFGHQLHGHVLEGERRAVPQLQQPQVVVELGQRNGAVGAQEGPGGSGAGGFAGRFTDVDGEIAQQGACQGGVVALGQGAPIASRIGVGQIEAAVGRQTVEQGVGKGLGARNLVLGEAARTYIVHIVTISAACALSPQALQARPII